MATSSPLVSSKCERVTCTICLELFRSPRLLPCHHTFCLHCLRNLASRHGNTSFPCPSCRKTATVPAGGIDEFQVNFYLEDDLAEAQTAASKPQPEQPVCTNSQSTSDQGKQGQASQRGENSTGSTRHQTRKESSHQQRVQEQDKELKTLRQKLEQLRQQYKTAKKEQDRIKQHQVEKIRNLQEELKKQKADFEQRSVQLVEKELHQEKLLSDITKEKDQLQQYLHAVHKERDKLRERLKEKEARMKELEKDTESLQHDSERVSPLQTIQDQRKKMEKILMQQRESYSEAPVLRKQNVLPRNKIKRRKNRRTEDDFSDSIHTATVECLKTCIMFCMAYVCVHIIYSFEPVLKSLENSLQNKIFSDQYWEDRST